ncbi:MAG: response regulator [Candidatus Anammoxibacter sp.]
MTTLEPQYTDVMLPEEPKKILYVEDDINNVKLVRLFLQDTDYQLYQAKNGQVAVDKFMAGNYDIVLMDIEMPVMDGLAATREIRAWETEQGMKRTPIIALTASESPKKTAAAGCTEYLMKPIGRINLIKTLKKYFKD